MRRPAVYVLGIAGSLRQDSFNRRLLEAAARLAPPGMQIVVQPIGRVPLYDADVEAAGLPPSVRRLREAIEAADGLLIVTPEYNRGIPGPLKNAIDWASRPAFQSPLAGKPIALVGATPARGGAQRALEHLREVLESTRAEVVGALNVPSVHEKIDGEEIRDPALEHELRQLLVRLRDAIRGSVAERAADSA